MSNGYATVAGNRVDYILRMPVYEMTHVRDPAMLLDHIRFMNGFETGRRDGAECHRDDSVYLCAAGYQFSKPVTELGVECTFFDVTVANHIHMLHAEWGNKRDEAILDSTIASATLRFRPPTAFEEAAAQIWQGAKRTPWLLAIALAIAARSRRELLLCAGSFLLAQCFTGMSSWQLNARFADAAGAIALGYLGFEIAVFPESGWRWLVASCLGAVSGLYFAAFAMDSGFHAGWLVAGAASAASIVWAAASLRRIPVAVARICGAGLLAFAVFQFLRTTFQSS